VSGHAFGFSWACILPRCDNAFVAEAPLAVTWEEVLNLADMALYRAKARRDAWLGRSGLAKRARQTELFNLIAADRDAAVRYGYIDVRVSQETEGETTEVPARRTRV
jgi:hypothetical protein